MADLIYSPGVSVMIDSSYYGLIDVSNDITSLNLTLNENRPHSVQLSLTNSQRKYDSAFAPGDRISVRLKRIKWLQIFSGYLTTVPYYSAFPTDVALTGECTLRNLKNFLWDSTSTKSESFIMGINPGEDSDKRLPEIITKLMTEVAQWPKDKIHIGGIPSAWKRKFDRVYTAIDSGQQRATDIIGVNPTIGGTSAAVLPNIPPFGGSTLSGDERIVFSEADIPLVLATIRQIESGGNYTIEARGGSTASGAYQYLDSTWSQYGGYRRAKDAPPGVQDAKATEDVLSIFRNRGNLAVNVPYSWYYPAVFNDPSLLDTIPYESQGNTQTIRQYGQKWLNEYKRQYERARNSAPTYQGASPSPGGVYYPIEEGVTRLTNQTSQWGGYSNGRIPASALRSSQTGGYNAGAHPIAGEAWDAMYQAALLEGYDLKASCYRSYEQQVDLWDEGRNSRYAAEPGTSNHGWGLAFDISVLVPSSRAGKKYPNNSNDQMYTTPEYLWLARNAYKWGFGHPTWAQKGGSKPEAWHWEFFAFSNFKDGGSPGNVSGVNPFDSVEGFGIASGSAYNALQYWNYLVGEAERQESDTLTGAVALANDEPILTIIERFVKASGRNFSSAPNGDFISWFPDYFGEYGVSGYMDVELIELQDFTISWSDDTLITHQYVTGVYNAGSQGTTPTGYGQVDLLQTRGIVTIDTPGLLEAIVGSVRGSNFPWMADPNEILARFGARVDHKNVSSILHGEQEFWYAVNLFSRAWAGQFTCSAPVTFMPELFPGMIMRIPDLGIQFYVSSVSHSVDMNSGFKTRAVLMAPSKIGEGGIFMFPKGGPV